MFIHVLPRIFKFNPRASGIEIFAVSVVFYEQCCPVEFDVVLNF